MFSGRKVADMTGSRKIRNRSDHVRARPKHLEHFQVPIQVLQEFEQYDGIVGFGTKQLRLKDVRGFKPEFRADLLRKFNPRSAEVQSQVRRQALIPQ